MSKIKKYPSVHPSQSAVMRNKCTADCARFLDQNESAIDASHSGTELKKMKKKTNKNFEILISEKNFPLLETKHQIFYCPWLFL